MDVREKLVWLQDESDICPEGITSCIGCKYHKEYAFGNPCDVRAAIADKMIAHGVTVQEWISVKDRLPEAGEIVLVCGSRGGVYTAVLNKPGQYKGWHKLNSKRHYCNPTHWMPMPQPPKGEI